MDLLSDFLLDFLYVGMLLLCGLSMWAFIALCRHLERQEGAQR